MSEAIVPQLPPVAQGGQVSKSPLVVKLDVSRPPRPRLNQGQATIDPPRQLVAAVVLRAVLDAYYPTKDTPKSASESAMSWLKSDIGDSMLRHFVGVTQ